MGYLKTPETDQLTLPSDPAFWVRMKRWAAFGDTSAAQGAMMKVTPDLHPANGSPAGIEVVNEVELDSYMHTLVARMVVEWNLTDEQERPLPINVQAVALLHPKDGDFLALEAQKRQGGRPAAQQLPFEKQSGRHSTATRSPIQKQHG